MNYIKEAACGIFGANSILAPPTFFLLYAYSYSPLDFVLDEKGLLERLLLLSDPEITCKRS